MKYHSLRLKLLCFEEKRDTKGFYLFFLFEYLYIADRNLAYVDRPLSIGHGQTISAPSMIAIMLDVADLFPGLRVLEVGAGSGYNAALIAALVGERGSVTSIERIESIAAFGRSNLERVGVKNVKVVVGDGSLGYEEDAPYDRIIVTAAAHSIPDCYVDQLERVGKLIIPVGSTTSYQDLCVVEKKDGEVVVTKKGGCVFVPLIGKYGW